MTEMLFTLRMRQDSSNKLTSIANPTKEILAYSSLHIRTKENYEYNTIEEI